MGKVWRDFEEEELEELREKIKDIYDDATDEVALKMIVDVIGWSSLSEYFSDTINEIRDKGDLKHILNKYKEEV